MSNSSTRRAVPRRSASDGAGAESPSGHPPLPGTPGAPATPDFGEDGFDRNMLGDAPRDRRRVVAAFLLLIDLCTLMLPALLLGELGWGQVAYVVAALLIFALSGVYGYRITLEPIAEAPTVIQRLGTALLLVAPAAVATGVDGMLPLHALLSVPAVVAGRVLSYALVRAARRRCLVQDPTLILGGGAVGMELLTTLYEHREYGLRPVGFLDSGSQLDERTPLGALHDVDQVLKRYGVRKVIIAFGTTRAADLVEIVRNTNLQDVDIYTVPRFFEVGLAPSGPDVEDLWGVPVYRVRRAAMRRGAWRAKRLFDIGMACVLIVLLAPLLAGLAVAVRLTSPGPVFFRQIRTGHEGRQITVLKFRSLRQATTSTGPVGAGTTSETMQARSADVRSRETPIGGFLRRTSLDELPQLYNILRGDMSFVGPRPEESTFAAEFAGSVYGYRERHRLTVGLTGWAQVHGLRGNTSIEERARFDNQYIEHWSLWKDFVILAATLAAVVRQAVRPSDQGRRPEHPAAPEGRRA